MIEPPWFLSLLLVLLAGRPPSLRRPRAEAPAPGPGRVALAAGALTAVALLAVVASAPRLASGLAVTAPSVRLAAAVAVGTVAIGRLLTPGRREDPNGAALPYRLGTGPLRVEVAVALWALTLDHGAGIAVAAVAAVVALELVGAPPVPAGAERAGRTAWCSAALVVAVLVGIDGILGL